MTDREYCCDRMRTAVEADLIDSGAIVVVGDSWFGNQPIPWPINYCPFCGKPLETRATEDDNE